jgi:hypothetical protein
MKREAYLVFVSFFFIACRIACSESHKFLSCKHAYCGICNVKKCLYFWKPSLPYGTNYSGRYQNPDPA